MAFSVLLHYRNKILFQFQVSYWFDNARRQLVVASAMSELGPEDTRKIAQNKLISIQQSAQTLQEPPDEPPTKIVRMIPNEAASTSTTPQTQFKCHTPQNALCYQMFADLQSLRDHMRTHADTLYKCTQCEKSFLDELDLKNHQFNYRVGGLLTCSKKGNEALSMVQSGVQSVVQPILPARRKMPKLIDIEENPFKCLECGERFKIEKNLTLHLAKVHRIIIQCDKCNKRFGNVVELEKHNDLVHPPIVAKPILPDLVDVVDPVIPKSGSDQIVIQVVPVENERAKSSRRPNILKK